MTDTPAPDTPVENAAADAPPRLGRLVFHGPLSERRAGDLVRRLAAGAPRTVLDLGCGWGSCCCGCWRPYRGRGASAWT